MRREEFSQANNSLTPTIPQKKPEVSQLVNRIDTSHHGQQPGPVLCLPHLLVSIIQSATEQMKDDLPDPAYDIMLVQDPKYRVTDKEPGFSS